MKNKIQMIYFSLIGILLISSCTVGNSYKTAHLELINAKKHQTVLQKINSDKTVTNVQYQGQSKITAILPLQFQLDNISNENSNTFNLKSTVPILKTTNKTETKLVQTNRANQVKRSIMNPGKKSSGGKSQIIAAVLCFLLGYLGIHRFYLGYTTVGILQLLTAGGCGIWALIDLIRILTGDLQPANGSYSETL